MDCPKCFSSRAVTTSVDNREMYRCPECNHQWYNQRDWVNGPLTFLDEIADAVSEAGVFEIPTSLLINCVWLGDDFHRQASSWCKSHNLSMSLTNRRDSNEVSQVAVFVRRS